MLSEAVIVSKIRNVYKLQIQLEEKDWITILNDLLTWHVLQNFGEFFIDSRMHLRRGVIKDPEMEDQIKTFLWPSQA